MTAPLPWGVRTLGPALLLAMSACPFATPVVERPEGNMGPSVDLNLVEPEPGDEVVFSPGAGKVRFVIPSIEDPDLDDILVARWFVNYEENGSLFHQLTIYPTGRVERSGTTLEIDPCSRTALRRAPRIHVEVDISDREFLGQDLSGRPFRAVPDDARVLTFDWWIVPANRETFLCPEEAP